MTYLEELKIDIGRYAEETSGWDLNPGDYAGDLEGFRNDLEEACWIADDVTGNASGSYYFNGARAREKVLENPDEVREALGEFCDAEEIGNMFLDQDYEKIDVITRCYWLGLAIQEFVDENDIEELLDSFLEDDEDGETAAELIGSDEKESEEKTA